MPETLPVDPTGAGASPVPDREARIEELLLSGLDHYFAGKYEAAINIWTRVAFLERGHGRARAYIERARGAQAERQREHDELLHRGVAAYQAGDMDLARRLLTQAVDEGGPTDVALTFLQRLHRFEAATGSLPPPSRGTRAGADAPPPAAARRWLPLTVTSAVLALMIVLLAVPLASWIAEWPVAVPAVETRRLEPLPIVRTPELLVERARALYRDGKLKEALAMLDRIDPTDVVRGEADRLRASVQRAALAAAGVPVERTPAR